MPIKSKAQQRLMFAALAGKVKDVSPKVAKEFIEATPKEKFKKLKERLGKK